MANGNTIWGTKRRYKDNIVIVVECRVVEEERSIFWEVILWVIVRKEFHMNMSPILNGYRYTSKAA
jgi:hypothetical protein